MKDLSKISMTFLLAGYLICLSSAASFSAYEIIKSQRIVQLNGAYPIEITKNQYVCIEQTCPDYLYYAIPGQLSEKVNKISFTQNKGDSVSYPSSISKYEHNERVYDLYKVQLSSSHYQDAEFTLYIQVSYINRYVNYPQSISLSQDQKFEYEDNKNIVSPYKIRQSSVSYKFSKILNFDSDGQKKGVSGANYKGTNIQPFSSEAKHNLHGVNNEPQVVFSEVERVIQVSHWGNIAIVQFYKLKNTGPQLKGQFSRIQFSSQNSFQAKNAFRGIQTTLPYQIWGLYYRDEVGNISTSRAYKDHHNEVVKFALTPRYALLGGWKCNWEIGYNLNTKGFLKHEGNQFSLQKIPIEYAFNKVLTEQYKIRIILPEGSSNPQFYIADSKVDMTNVVQTQSFGFLDFNGRPQYTIPDLKGQFNGRNLKVTYSYDQKNLLKKPLIVFAAIFSVLFAIIVLKRLNLNTFIEDQHMKSN